MMHTKKLIEIEFILFCGAILIQPIQSAFYRIAGSTPTQTSEYDGLPKISYIQCVLRCKVKCKKAVIHKDNPNQCLCLHLNDKTVLGEDNLLEEETMFVSFNYLISLIRVLYT